MTDAMQCNDFINSIVILQLPQNNKGIYKESVELTLVYPVEGCFIYIWGLAKNTFTICNVKRFLPKTLQISEKFFKRTTFKLCVVCKQMMDVATRIYFLV